MIPSDDGLYRKSRFGKVTGNNTEKGFDYFPHDGMKLTQWILDACDEKIEREQGNN